jgi:glycosyltransferase involved in cell wall biosynthesis
MLSVLIPVYNFDVRDLVKCLCTQAAALGTPYEILVLDDASHEDFLILNRETSAYPGVKYLEERKNLGRSKIRNKMADMAQYNYLLFLDCDSMIEHDYFLKRYIENINNGNVVYGGREYTFIDPKDGQFKLHWLHGIKREQISAEVRSVEPNRSFMTNNFLIAKKTFTKVRFNETIKGYGHEDTLFGYDLQKCNIAINHIDNPVIHIGLESNEEFLRKTREGIKNLKRIMNINGNEKKLVRDITLLSYYKKLKIMGLDGILKYMYSKNEYRLRKNLLSQHPNLILFDLYKLGYLCSLNGDYNSVNH